MDSNLNIIDAGEGNKPSRTFSSTLETGSYGYEFANTSILKNTKSWLASRDVYFQRL